jgi:aspartyl-tRNA(Asn)/glutamyl-tRNA(Gln) amidotransferase subunit B
MSAGDSRGGAAQGLTADIGLEVHVQLRTRSKLFCACPADFGAPPNTHVCPVCLGYPGAMPVLNGSAVRLTVMAGLMLGSRVNAVSHFDRKSYFYPDMPKNYQISQYDRPLCEGGALEFAVAEGARTVRIRRIHLEEDVAKNIHFAACSGVDFNRAGVPLMEIVSEPDLHTPAEAMAFLQSLREILLHTRVSDCNLEEGNVRCDVNVSLRPAGAAALGVKVEIKNMNTFKGVFQALAHEIERQGALLGGGGRAVQETRRWDPDAGATSSMRTKEDEQDYRYFPEPDLPPVTLAAETLAVWRAELPEAPRARRARLTAQYGLPEYDAGVLAADPAVADFFEAAAQAGAPPKVASNWIMTEMLRLMAEAGTTAGKVPLTPAALARLTALQESGALNSSAAKEVFAELFARGGDPEAIMRARGLEQLSDAGALEALVGQVLAAHPGPAADYRSGKTAALQFLVGQVMRLSRGKAHPSRTAELLRARIGLDLRDGSG